MKNLIKITDIGIIARVFFGVKNLKEEKLFIASMPGQMPDTSRADFVIDLTNQKKVLPGYKKMEISYINNPDKSIRWMFETGKKNPAHLSFYNSSGIKPKVYKILSCLFFKIGFGALLSSGRITLYYKNGLPLAQKLIDYPFESFSVFTGTIGPNRKAIVSLETPSKVSHFVKIPIGENAESLIKNEMDKLSGLSRKQHQYFNAPKAALCDGMLVQQNLKNKTSKTAQTLTDVHFKALDEIYSSSYEYMALKSLPIVSEIQKNISAINPYKELKHNKNIFRNLQHLLQSLDLNEKVPTGLAHQDFTPWNMYVDDGKLALYDWEMSQENMPLFFDVFHFVFQAKVLIEHENFDHIQDEISRIKQSPLFARMQSKYQVNVELHFKLYLLYTISYYLNVFQKQQNLHQQASWLLDVWNQALELTYPYQRPITHRTRFVHQFFSFLSKKQYAVLKNNVSIYQLDEHSDIDILIPQTLLPQIQEFLLSLATVIRVKTFKKSYMHIVELYFADQSFISLDLIFKFKRKSTSYLNAAELLSNISKDEFGIKVLQPNLDLEYAMLFYVLNNADVPERYRKHYNRLEDNNQLLNYLNKKYYTDAENLNGFYRFSSSLKSRIMNKVSAIPANKGWKKILNIMDYVLDTLNESLFRTGSIISFSGVDGAGKSTIIDEMAENLRMGYRKKVVVLRHRPLGFPILSSVKHGKSKAESIAAASMPRQGDNKNQGYSLIRFLYYFTDYFLGRFYIYVRYIMRNYIVIYDRYYFDFISDPKRSNINLNKSWVKSLYRLIYKPNLNVFLYASPEVILKRKQELNANDILSLTSGYMDLFNDFSKRYKNSKYKTIENIRKEKTMQVLMQEYSKSI
jgi:thymidylate kinase